MTEDNRTVWIARKIEGEEIFGAFRQAAIDEKSEVIVTDDSVEIADSETKLLDILGGNVEELFDPSNTVGSEEMKDMIADGNSEQTGIRCGKGSGFFSRTFLKNNEESDAAKNMKEDIEENSEFYNSLAVEPEDEED